MPCGYEQERSYTPFGIIFERTAMFKFFKIIFIVLFGAVCLAAASDFAEKYAAEKAGKEQTLAEAVMKSRLEEEIKKAEAEAAKELEEQGHILVTEQLETKPQTTAPVSTSVTKPETTVTEQETTSETAVSETEITETETSLTETSAAKDEIKTDFTRGGLLPEDRSSVPLRSMFALSESEKNTVMDFLIEHYFLDGYKYSNEETRPELKEKKRMAAEMESGVIETVNMLFDSMDMSDISSMLSADYGKMKDDVSDIRSEFEEKYSDAYSYGENFGKMYDDSLKYFDRLIKAIENLENTSKQYKEASNPLLALGLLTSSIDDVIIPEIMGVLEQSFDLVEVSQEIFLEGTQGAQLLTRDEVKAVISNPGLVLQN